VTRTSRSDSDGTQLTRIEPDGLPLSAYLGVLGTTGLTAYGGLLVSYRRRVSARAAQALRTDGSATKRS